MQKKYQQLRNDLLSEFILGKKIPGTAIPSERDIARSYGLSRISVRHAIECLLKEGYLEKSSNGRNVICGIPSDGASKKILLLVRDQNAVMPEIYRMIYEALLLKCSLSGISLFCYSEKTFTESQNTKLRYEAVLGLGIRSFPKTRLSADRFILLDDNPETKVHCIATDNFSGGVMAAKHLLKQGYKRPLFLGLSDQKNNSSFMKRQQGFCSYMKDAGISVGCRYASNSSAIPVLSTLQRWSELKEADSLFVLNDYIAVNVFHALKKLEISIPDQLAVISFDGLDSSRYLLPSLTTIVQPINKIADKALEFAVSDKPMTKNLLIPPEIISRESTKKKKILCN